MNVLVALELVVRLEKFIQKSGFRGRGCRVNFWLGMEDAIGADRLGRGRHGGSDCRRVVEENGRHGEYVSVLSVER